MSPTSILQKLPVRLVALAAATYLASKRAKNPLSPMKAALGAVVAWYIYSIRAKRPDQLAVPKGFLRFLPWMGHFYLFPWMKDAPHETLLDLSQKYNFESFALCFPDDINFLVVHNEEDRKYFLKTNFKNYNKLYDKKLGMDHSFGEMLGQGIFATDGDEWRTHRKVASKLFTGNMIGVTMKKVFHEHAEQLKAVLLDKADKNEAFDIQLLLQSLIFDAFCGIAFGTSPKSFELAVKGEKQEFQSNFDYAQATSARRAMTPPLLRDFLIFAQFSEEAKMTRSIKQLDEYIYAIIKERKKKMAEDPEKFENVYDILGLYLNQARKYNRPELESEVYLRDLIMNFMIAGRDTTSYVLTNIFSLMAENPQEDAKLHADVKERMTQLDGPLDKNIINDFTLGDAVFNEALRMYPSVGIDFRIAAKDDVLPSGIKVKAGTMVTVSNYAVGRNPKYFDEPNSFKPQRWIKAVDGKLDWERLDEYKFPFFWAGYRICLGKDMARFEAKLFMNVIFNTIKFTMAKPRKLRFSQGPVMFYEEGIWLKADRRE